VLKLRESLRKSDVASRITGAAHVFALRGLADAVRVRLPPAGGYAAQVANPRLRGSDSSTAQGLRVRLSSTLEMELTVE